MEIFKKKSKSQKTTKLSYFERIYQYANAQFLPDTSQPNPKEDYEITTNIYSPHTSTRYMNVVIGSNGKAQSNGKDTDKELPELYKVREDCCGCTACCAVCPIKAVCMRPDEEGFEYPVVDADKCIRCYKCVAVCPIKQKMGTSRNICRKNSEENV